MVVDELHDLQHGVEVLLHVRNLDIADRAAGRERLELRLERQLVKGVDLLRHVDVIGVGDIVLVRDARDDTEALLQALGEFIRRGLQRRAVEGEIDVGLGLPLGTGVVEMVHDVEREGRRGRVGVGLAGHVLHALIEPRVAERDRRVAAVEQLVDGLALFEPGQRAVLPEDRGRVGERPLEPVVAAHERAVAQIEPLVKNTPEFIQPAAGGQRHVDQIDRHDALVEPAVVLGLARLVVARVRHVVPAVAGPVRRQETAAAHAGVHVAVACGLALGELQLAHLLLGDIVRHHALGGAAGGELRQLPVGAVFRDVVLLEDVDELREGGCDPHALFVLDALDALAERLFDDDGQILALLLVPGLAEVHEDRDERRLPVGGHERDDLILDGLHAAADLVAQPGLDDLGDRLLRRLHAEGLDLLQDGPADLLPGDVDERRQVRQRNGLAAILVGGDLRDDLRGDVAGRGEAVRLFDERAGDDRAVLQHILEIDQIAVVHVLGEVIRVVEVDDALVMRLDDVLRQQHAGRQILGDLTRHIVALDGVDGRVLVGVFLLDLFVVRLDEGQDLLVRRVGLADERAGIAVGDIVLGDLKRAVRHDLVLNQVLDLLDGQGTVHGQTAVFHALGDAADLHRRHARVLCDDVVGLGHGRDDLDQIEGSLRAVSLDDLHGRFLSFYFCARKKRAGTGFVASRCGAVITIPDIGGAVKHLGLYFVDIDDRKSRETQYLVFHGIRVYEGSDKGPGSTGFRGSARGTGACAQPAGFR